MRVQHPFTCRRHARSKPLAILALIAMVASPVGRPMFTTTVHAQTQVAPVGNGFFINDDDLRFIFKQIQVSQANAAGGQLLGPGPNQVNSQAAPSGDPQRDVAEQLLSSEGLGGSGDGHQGHGPGMVAAAGVVSPGLRLGPRPPLGPG